MTSRFNKPNPADPRIDFVVAGAPKSGTTTLHAGLSLHPQIRMPARGGKELRHFDRPAADDTLSADSLARYHRAWDWHEADVLRGEASPGYLASNDAHGRLHAYRSDLRIVVVLRHPAIRAFSDWNMQVHRGEEKRSFDRAIRDELEGVPGSAYVDFSRYGSQLDRLCTRWHMPRLLVLRSEDLSSDLAGTMDRLCDFLDIRRMDYRRLRPRNVRAHLGRMHPSTARLLESVLEPEIDRLERRLGWDLRAWRTTDASIAHWLAGESLRRCTVAIPGFWRGVDRARRRAATLRSPWR